MKARAYERGERMKKLFCLLLFAASLSHAFQPAEDPSKSFEGFRLSEAKNPNAVEQLLGMFRTSEVIYGVNQKDEHIILFGDDRATLLNHDGFSKLNGIIFKAPGKFKTSLSYWYVDGKGIFIITPAQTNEAIRQYRGETKTIEVFDMGSKKKKSQPVNEEFTSPPIAPITRTIKHVSVANSALSTEIKEVHWNGFELDSSKSAIARNANPPPTAAEIVPCAGNVLHAIKITHPYGEIIRYVKNNNGKIWSEIEIKPSQFLLLDYRPGIFNIVSDGQTHNQSNKGKISRHTLSKTDNPEQKLCLDEEFFNYWLNQFNSQRPSPVANDYSVSMQQLQTMLYDGKVQFFTRDKTLVFTTESDSEERIEISLFVPSRKQTLIIVAPEGAHIDETGISFGDTILEITPDQIYETLNKTKTTNIIWKAWK